MGLDITTIIYVAEFPNVLHAKVLVNVESQIGK